MPEKMTTPAPEIRESLWQHIETAGHLSKIMLTYQRLTPKKREAFVRDTFKMFYLLGLDRGYDMAATIFGDSADAADDAAE